MYFSTLAILSFFSFLAGFALAAPTEFALEARNATGLSARDSNARLTWYDVGLGACGKTNKASDYVVALNAAEFGSGYPGPHCFKQIKITANGKSATATIVDQCPGCPKGGLDLSKGLFSHFANPDVGVLTGSWSYL
ncbi:hypothetical protein GLOTRDRAFT_130888 [Gloeophyllum trabeum ATCC 11539]|uniref:RlpA-like protein double-psi beta-barrel domain-containing protein n=1 Tax=Gloeophyllum trabeum (strain ATCC 11539 / FP-39264 / Madison 617) TaxID=670483 RepID=S7RLK0_GLOTA|nr:uncharacterized protein GLOTRDRAFT_130888 [Gloeophyllum trabeum ATCC 11539]EPQ53544.1 hypothetical protein GLOTRDRAFT_130888 [Gloeophyllum trabeum ATCC 11539]